MSTLPLPPLASRASAMVCASLPRSSAVASGPSTVDVVGGRCGRRRAFSNRDFSSIPPYVHSTRNNAHVNNIVKSTRVPRPPAVKLKREMLKYSGNSEMPLTSTLKITMPNEDAPSGVWPCFRMMDESGSFRQTKRLNPVRLQARKGDSERLKSALILQYPQFRDTFLSSKLLRDARHEYPDTNSNNTLLRAHRQMIRLRAMDSILLNAQRQGRISFYMTQTQEEAIHFGAASALENQDVILAQYREAGLLMWRGFTLEQFTNQCFTNDMDLNKGKQMPVHYGSRALNYQTISSPLGTQITQAVGVAYKLKMDAAAYPERDRAISIVFFGDGAASSVDFHSACNFAATLKTPMIFFCRNNGYAISTPTEDQYAGDGIVSRAPGYGMAAIRVDGNDLFAVNAAVAEARKVALDTSAPVLIEAMTYRGGGHSTSDDPTRYRKDFEVRSAGLSDPLSRLSLFLESYGWVDAEEIAATEAEERAAVLDAMKLAEARPKPKIDHMFTDVYHDKPPSLVKQEMELHEHLQEFGTMAASH